MIKIRFEGSFGGSKGPETKFGLSGVISLAAICFPSHRSLFTMMYFIGSFEYRVLFPVKTRSSMATGSELFAFLERGIVQIFGQIVFITVMTLINTNALASRLIKREKALLPVAVGRSKTPLNFICDNESVMHSNFSGRNGFLFQFSV